MEADSTYDPGEASHRALRGIRRELERHPAVLEVRGFPSGELTQVVAELASVRFGIEDDATLTVRWFAGETPSDPPTFSFHFTVGERDFGWHHEPNPHVEGRGHYQERTGEGRYSYERYSFASDNPTRVVWEVMSMFTSELEGG